MNHRAKGRPRLGGKASSTEAGRPGGSSKPPFRASRAWALGVCLLGGGKKWKQFPAKEPPGFSDVPHLLKGQTERPRRK